MPRPMPETTEPQSEEAVLRTLQIIIIALTMGAAMFLVIVVLLMDQPIVPQRVDGAAPGPPAVAGLPLITLAAVLVGATALAMSYVVPRVIAAGGRRHAAARSAAATSTSTSTKRAGGSRSENRIDGLLGLFQTQLIVGAAVAEGGAFFAGIAYMLERHPVALLTALVLLAALASRFPTRGRLDAWLDQQRGLPVEEG